MILPYDDAPVKDDRPHSELIANIARYVACVFEPDDLVEVRQLWGKDNSKSAWHNAREVAQHAAAWAMTNERRHNVYIGVNPRKCNGGKARDVALARMLVADLDGGCTVDDALLRIRAAELPEPTLIIQTGHGVHVYWRLLEPLADLAEWSRLQSLLIRAIGGDPKIKDAPRILRLPGYLNWNCKCKPQCADGRCMKPPPRASIATADLARRYAVEALAPVLERFADKPMAAAPTVATIGRPRTEVEERARAYLAKLPGAVSGERGHDRTFRTACVLVLGFGLTPNQAYPLLAEWNTSCEPPWTEKDLRHKLHDADKQTGERGYLLGDKPEPHKASARNDQPKRKHEDDPASRAFYAPKLINLGDVKPEPVLWLWPGRIARGKLTLLAGDPGLGKSFITIDLAARVSLGSPWPDDPLAPAPIGRVVMLNAEDDLADTVRPRLDAAGADVTRITALAAVTDDDGEKQFNLQRDLAALEQAIADTPDCKLVIIDPITAYLGNCDSHKNADIRAVLAPLAELAARYKVAVVAVSHLNKGSGPALYRTMGSLAFVAAARAAWVVVKDKEAPKRRMLLPVKNNLAEDTAGMAYAIVDGILAWEADPVTISADEILGDDRRKDGHSERDDAGHWLRQLLRDGRLSPKEIKAQADDAGFSWATIRRAKDRASVRVFKEGFGKDSRWFWELSPQRCAAEGEDAQPSDVSAFDETERLWPDDPAADGGSQWLDDSF
jgi:hypothetical protein